MMRNCSGAPRASAEGKEEDAAFASGLQGRGGGLCLGTAAERRHPCKMLPTGACHLLGGQVLCKVAEPFKRPDGCDLFPSRCDAATFQLTSRRLSLLETPHLKGHPEHSSCVSLAEVEEGIVWNIAVFSGICGLWLPLDCVGLARCSAQRDYSASDPG
ncbi:uncharacterized protein [Narcine bancroftii]|uniref:uncharacterized protein isoform X6 n=1 Tax=Narcine bancroftii TaxID=1343680 RepID=UPI00383177ED